MRKVIPVAVAVAALVCVPLALAASSPIVTPGATTRIGQNAATLHATVNPNGLATTYQFHYGPTSSLGSVFPTTAASAGSGSTRVAEAAAISGLSPDTTYYYQFVASNSAGSSSTAIGTFKTTGNPAPTTTTSPAVDVTRYGATLVGVINPNNQTTSYHFEYGLSSSYGFQSMSDSLAAGATPVAVSIQLPGLQPGQVYHYRVVADHGSHSVTYGSDMTFQTPPWPRPHSRLSLGVKPGVDGRAPFVYVLTGAVRHTATVPASYGCHGMVRIAIYHGRRHLATHTVPVGVTTCTFRTRFRFGRVAGIGARRLAVRARYLGDVWDAPATRSATVWAG